MYVLLGGLATLLLLLSSHVLIADALSPKEVVKYVKSTKSTFHGDREIGLLQRKPEDNPFATLDAGNQSLDILGMGGINGGFAKEFKQIASDQEVVQLSTDMKTTCTASRNKNNQYTCQAFPGLASDICCMTMADSDKDPNSKSTSNVGAIIFAKLDKAPYKDNTVFVYVASVNMADTPDKDEFKRLYFRIQKRLWMAVTEWNKTSGLVIKTFRYCLLSGNIFRHIAYSAEQLATWNLEILAEFIQNNQAANVPIMRFSANAFKQAWADLKSSGSSGLRSFDVCRLLGFLSVLVTAFTVVLY